MLDWILKDHDTEDRSNDAENSALITGINYISQHIQIKNVFLNGMW